MRVDVALAPPARAPIEATCLVVDVLRATSVMAVLFGRGLRLAWLAGSIEEGRAIRAALGERPGGVMLCGEVDALPPAGFDHGNSPLEFERLALPAEAVLATTNGTPALLACTGARLVLPAAPLNAAAAVRVALDAGRDVLVVCSGRVAAGLRVPGEDDTLAAGLIVERLALAGARPGDEALFALEAYEAAREDLGAALRTTPHGARITALGFGADVDRCARTDVYDAVAVLGVEQGRPVLRPLARSTTGHETR
ncbi:MAG: 2-phosphosulfolactate phosphatase [Dehalococcoidia bacterium]